MNKKVSKREKASINDPARQKYRRGKTKSEVTYRDTAGIENDDAQCYGQAVSTKAAFKKA